MAEFETTQKVPLTRGDDGTIRIAGSRVALDSLVREFKDGATAEQIQEDFPSLALRDIYAAIAYYLQDTEVVEEYLRRQQADATQIRSEIERGQSSATLRARLRQRRALPIK